MSLASSWLSPSYRCCVRADCDWTEDPRHRRVSTTSTPIVRRPSVWSDCGRSAAWELGIPWCRATESCWVVCVALCRCRCRRRRSLAAAAVWRADRVRFGPARIRCCCCCDCGCDAGADHPWPTVSLLSLRASTLVKRRPAWQQLCRRRRGDDGVHAIDGDGRRRRQQQRRRWWWSGAISFRRCAVGRVFLLGRCFSLRAACRWVVNG